MGIPRIVGRFANALASTAGVRLERDGAAMTIGGRALSDEDVVRRAAAAGVSPGTYVERLFGREGRAGGIIERMCRVGALEGLRRGAGASICEIGPGSGLYVERLLELGRPRRYEIYELAPNRARFLERTFPVTRMETDGETLAGTRDGSIDLIHAHGVFVTLKLVPSFRYFEEMGRVVSPGGWAIFDVITEDCIDPETVRGWLDSNLRYARLLPRRRIVEFFAANGFELVDEFRLPLLVQGHSRYLCFRRTAGVG